MLQKIRELLRSGRMEPGELAAFRREIEYTDVNRGKVLMGVGIVPLENPELVGSAEWTLRLWINGLERWQSPKLRVDQGQTVAIDAEIETQIHGYTEILEVEIQARSADHAAADLTRQILHRHGFHRFHQRAACHG